MDEQFRKIQRHNRIIWAILIVLVSLSFASVLLALREPKTSTIQQNYIGKDGKDGQTVIGPQGEPGHTPVKGVDYFDGEDAVVDYKALFSYIDAQIATIPKPTNGVDGTNGTNGSDGIDGRTSEFDCQNGNFVTRYQGDDGWRVLQENSAACRETNK